MWLGLFLALVLPLQAQAALSAQDELLRTYGVQAVDKTDRHAPVVLESFLHLLKHAFTPQFIRGLKGVRYLYAYAGHDRIHDLAAYHPKARAISIGGQSSYGATGHSMDVRVLTTLAHELGHAFLLERVSPRELQQIGAKFGGWGAVADERALKDHYAKELFARHPASVAAASGPGVQGVCSRLSTRNLHEWFADAFAAAVLLKMGRAGRLGADWEAQVVSRPSSAGEYWYDYRLVSAGFSEWLEARLGR